jgi:DNA polymerase-3 subunit delta
MDIQTLKKSIKKGDVSPIYVLYGTQKFMMDEIIQEISKKVLDEQSIDFNFETFDLNNQPLEAALEAAQTPPFIGEKRLVVVSEAMFLTGAKSQTKIEHDVSSLEKYIESPVDFSVLILLVNQEKLDERKKVVKSLKKNAILCPCSTLQTQQLIPWLQETSKENHVILEEEAAVLLIQFVGGNMQLLSKEIEKMGHFVGKGQTITTSTVHELVSKSIEQDVFTLVDHVVQHRIAEAFDSLHELLKRSEEPIKIVFLLARQFRMIYKAKELDRLGYTPNQMTQILGVHPYVCKLVLQQGKNFSEQGLLKILDQLAETDYLMKVGKLDKVLALEMFFLKL